VDVQDPTESDGLPCRSQLIENGHKALQPIVRNMDHDEADAKFAKIMFDFKPAINRNKYIELGLSEREQRQILSASPPAFRNRLNGVA
jgi:hypothetical protein